jgi:hypothetical protein
MKNQRTTSKCTLIFSFIRYIHSHISSKVTLITKSFIPKNSKQKKLAEDKL